MSNVKITTQECIMLFAYLNYIKTPKVHCVSIQKNSYNDKVEFTLCNKPHRPEPVRKHTKKTKYSLNELLAEIPENKIVNTTDKSVNQKPHRQEPIRKRTEKTRYTLNELLSKMTDKNRHEEVDSGDSVGSEVWWE